jgi:hypothetical protein
MFLNGSPYKSKPGLAQSILAFALKVVFVAVACSILVPVTSRAEGPVKPITQGDGLLKPTGSAESNVTLWFPEGAVNTDVLATADYVPETALPAGISYPPNVVGLPITFGLWANGATLPRFVPSIVVNVRYQDGDVPPALSAQEEQLYLYMYNPATQSWMKLCSSVNIYENVISAALSFPTPYEENGGSLLAIAANNTPPLEQTVDGQGITNISISGSSLNFQVLPEAIEVGSNFEVTTLPNVLNSGQVKLRANPVDLKLCRIDHTLPVQKSFQLTTDFAKPLTVEFKYDPDTLARIGDKANLKLVYLKEQEWDDVEASGATVVRDDEAISFDTKELGTFGLASN